MISIAICTLVLAQAQTIDQKVTFEHGTASVQEVVRALAEKTGSPLAVPPALGNEFVFVSVKDAPLKEVLDRIADVTACEWKEKDHKLWLTRSAAKLRQEEKDAIEFRLKGIEKGLAKACEALAEKIDAKRIEAATKERRELERRPMDNQGFDNSRWQRLTNLQSLTPARRTLLRMLSVIDPRVLTTLNSGDRIVFSTSPTAMQKRLPPKAEAALASFKTEQVMWAEAGQNLPKIEDSERIYRIGQEDGEAYLSPQKEPIAKTLLIFEQDENNFGGPLSALLILAGEKDNVLYSSREQIAVLDEKAMNDLMKAPAPASPHPIDLSPDFHLLLDGIKGAFGRGNPKLALPENLRNILSSPDKNEPLGLSTTDPFRAVAAERKTNIVASIPDFAHWMIAFLAMAPDRSVDMYLSALRTAGEMRIEESNGWLMARPGMPARARELREDRTALGKFLRRAVAENRLSLDNAAEYSITNLVPQNHPSISQLHLMLLGLTEYGQQYHAHALRLYGSLSASQKELLQNGGKLLLGSMTPYQLSQVTRLLYGAYARSAWESRIQEYERSKSQMNYSYRGSTLRTEPTEAFPFGVPRDGYLTLARKESVVIFASSADQQNSWPQEIDQFGMNLYQQEHPDIFPWVRNQPALDRFRVGDQKDIDMTIYLSSTMLMSENLKDSKMKTEGVGVPLNQLPQDIQDRIKKAMDRAKEMYKNAKPGDYQDFNQRSKPPPP